MGGTTERGSDRRAKQLVEPVLEEESLPESVIEEAHDRAEDGEYVEALRVVLYHP